MTKQAPKKRAPAVKETKFRMDPSANKVTWGAPQPSKKPAPKKAPAAPAKSAVISEKKEVGNKAAKTVSGLLFSHMLMWD